MERPRALLQGGALALLAMGYLCLNAGCSDDTPDRSGADAAVIPAADKGDNPAVDTEVSGPDAGPKNELAIYLNEELLGTFELTYLLGRTCGRVALNAKDDEAKAELESFARTALATIPADGSKPTTDQELKALVPGSGEIGEWAEDAADGVSGPWLINTDAYAWINGGGEPFQQNGFVAVAGEAYLWSEKSWRLTFEVVNMGSVEGALAAFTGAGWNEGTEL